jgi:hypothetical protein
MVMRLSLALVQLPRTRDFHRQLLSPRLETTDDWPRKDVVAFVLAAVNPLGPCRETPLMSGTATAHAHTGSRFCLAVWFHGMGGGTSATTAALIVSLARNHTRIGR